MVETDTRDKIKDSGLTLSEVARQANINKGKLSDISWAKRIPTPDEKTKIEDVIGEQISFWVTVEPRGVK